MTKIFQNCTTIAIKLKVTQHFQVIEGFIVIYFFFLLSCLLLVKKKKKNNVEHNFRYQYPFKNIVYNF